MGSNFSTLSGHLDRLGGRRSRKEATPIPRWLQLSVKLKRRARRLRKTAKGPNLIESATGSRKRLWPEKLSSYHATFIAPLAQRKGKAMVLFFPVNGWTCPQRIQSQRNTVT